MKYYVNESEGVSGKKYHNKLYGKYKFEKLQFGKFTSNHVDNYISNLIEDEIIIAEKVINKYPKNDTLKKRAVRLLLKIKKKFIKFEYRKNLDSLIDVIQILISIMTVFYGMSEAYSLLHQRSGVFRYIINPLDKLIIRFSKKQDKITDNFETPIDFQI